MAESDFVKRELAKDVYMYTKRTDVEREVPGYVGVKETTIEYAVECSAFRELQFTLSWGDGTQNLAWPDDLEATSVTVKCLPYERKPLVTLVQQDLLQGWGLAVSSSWLESQPSEEISNAKCEENAQRIATELRTTKRLDFGADAATVDHLRGVCQANHVKFVDSEFPPVDTSLFSAQSKHAPAPGARRITWRRATEFLDADKLGVFVGGIEPSDVKQGALGDCWLLCSIAACTEFPWLVERMFKIHGDDAQPQGANEEGVYKVRLCKNGQWMYVRLDDYFPCYPGSGPVYAKTHEQQELWVPLLEKAMAKLCGSYDALRGGLPFEALMDLTGAPAAKVSFAQEDVQAQIADGRLWKRITEWDDRQFLITASTPGEDKWSEDGGGGPAAGPGLVPGHAYSVINASETHDGHKLLLIRNPWGDFESTLAWNDNDPRWQENDGAYMKELGVAEFNDHDGLFWMAFEDFLAHFDCLNVCYIQPGLGVPSQYSTDAEGNECAGQWVDQRRKGTFRLRGTGSSDTEEASAGPDGAGNDVINNSMYILTVPEFEGSGGGATCRTWVSLHQQDERVESAKPYLDMGVTVLRVLDDSWYADEDAIDYRDMAAAAAVQPPPMELAGATGVSVDRQTQLKLDLTPGRYLVVPHTTGCKFKMNETQSKLVIEEAVSAAGAADEEELLVSNPALAQKHGIVTSLITQPPCQWVDDSDWYMSQDGAGAWERDTWFVPAADRAFREVFHRVDEDMDNVLNWVEFNRYHQLLYSCDADESEFEWLLTVLDSVKGGLTPDGFVQYCWYMLQRYGGPEDGEKALWAHLHFMGYDRRLELNRARSFVMSVHSAFQASLLQVPFCAQVYEEALELPVKELGEKRVIPGEGGELVVYTHKAGYWGVTLAVENKYAQDMHVTVDCSDSDNLVSSAGALDSTMCVPAGETKICHHLLPGKQSGWSWAYSMAWKTAQE